MKTIIILENVNCKIVVKKIPKFQQYTDDLKSKNVFILDQTYVFVFITCTIVKQIITTLVVLDVIHSCTTNH